MAMYADHVKQFECDVLVVGGGQAGGFAAIKATEAGAKVILVDKGQVGKANQTAACNYFSIYDEKVHDIDAWKAFNHGKCDYTDNQDWVEIAFKESKARWDDLVSWGIDIYKWDKHGDVYVSPANVDDGGDPVIMPFRDKIVVDKDQPLNIYPFSQIRFPHRKNAEVIRRQCVKMGIQMVERVTITDLIRQNGRVVGAVGLCADDEDFYVFRANAVILASGAAGMKAVGIPTMTTTGDADAMGYRAGCEVTGKEWNDHHCVRADFPAWPWSGVDRDRLRSYRHKGCRFEWLGGGLPKYNSLGEKVGQFVNVKYWAMIDAAEAHEGHAPIYWEVINGAPEFLKMNHSPKDYPRAKVDEDAAKIGRVRMVFGRALGQSYHVSDGLWPTSFDCTTQVEGLYAAGDCLGARPGYAGAGYALTFCAVTGARAGTAAAKAVLGRRAPALSQEEIEKYEDITFGPMKRHGGFGPDWVLQIIQNTMFPYYVLIIKNGDRLKAALAQIEFVRDHLVPMLYATDTHELRKCHEIRSIVLCAEMKLKVSLERKESRWEHFREDYPYRDDKNYLCWFKCSQGADGKMVISREEIPQQMHPDETVPYEKRYPVELPHEERYDHF